MTPQRMTYIRNSLIHALNCGEGGSKGQLEAFEGFALARVTKYGRRRKRVIQIGNRHYCREGEPVHVAVTTGYKKQIVPLTPETYETSAWRRAVNQLKPYQLAWVRYCYAGDLNFDYQVQITTYVWEALKKALAGKRVTKKVMVRLAPLVWLAVQQYAGETIKGREYTVTELAKLMGISKSTFSECYAPYWGCLLRLLAEFECGILKRIYKNLKLSRSRNLSS
ncbi:bacteriophage antitermination protein Q [Yersinia enterocolitica]